MSNYSSDDYAYLYLDALRDFAASQGFNVPKRINVSWLIDNFQELFLESLVSFDPDILDRVKYRQKPSQLGEILVKLGLIDFDKIQNEMFTDSHKGLMKLAIKKMNLPKFAKVEITESEPLKVLVKFQVDYEKMVQNPNFIPIVYHQKVDSFKNTLTEVSGIKLGNYNSGFLTVISSSPVFINEEKVLNAYIKRLRQEVKNSPEFSDFIKSIRSGGSLNGDGYTNIKVIFDGAKDFPNLGRVRRDYSKEKFRSFANEFAKKVAEEMGYPSLPKFVKIISPTLERSYY
jgi:hypothetical protein